MPSVQHVIDRHMRNKWGFTINTRATIIYYGAQFWEQVLAVVPITMCLVVAMAIYFQKGVASPASLAGGLIAAMVGLVLFVDGLRVAIMPLGSLLGQQLPEQFKVRYILIIACAIGILCTYAEPAIASLRPLASLVKRCQTPYLYFVLNDLSEVLVLSIGVGVGVAAIIGVLRFLRGWSLKPLIACSLTPTIACACYMKWGNTELAPLIGLAWDCGAVTTGPVTVPILLSLGIGVIKGQKARHAARELVDAHAEKGSGQALEGFGIITLASTFPILAVEVMSIGISFRYTPEQIRTDFGNIDCATYVEDTQIAAVSDGQMILDAFTFAVRSILPLSFFLVLMIKVVLRQDLPEVSFTVPRLMGLLEDISSLDTLVVDADADDNQDLDDDGHKIKDAKQDMEERMRMKENKEEERQRKREMLQNAIAAVGGDADDVDRILNREKSKSTKVVRRQDTNEMSSRGDKTSQKNNTLPLVGGVLECMLGMTLFNIGLTYGFTALGDQSGLLLPAAFMQTDDAADSPYFGYSAGVAIVLSTIFSLGFLATRAEPALRVMGKTVETLSEGQFSQNALVYTVCVGVGCGMVLGSSKILFEVNIIYLILAKYTVAAVLTVFSSENFTNIAWDSAGVTTGPVTVPFVLSVGIGFSKAKKAQEGFGILTCASVAPIITVLFTDLLRRMMQEGIRRHNLRKLRRLVHTQSQTDTPEDLRRLLDAADVSGDGEVPRLRDAVLLADACTQCDVGIVPSGVLIGDGDSKRGFIESGDTLNGTSYSTSPIGAARPATDGNQNHAAQVSQSLSAALNSSLTLHNTPSTLQITPRRPPGAGVGVGGGVGGSPLSPRRAGVTTTITVTTNYVAPEDVELFTHHTAC